MPILSGSASLTRFNVASTPRLPDFDGHAFREIPTGSELRDSVGFVPFEPGGPWEVAAGRLAFRVRLDRVTPDPTAVRERTRALLQIERETVGERPIPPSRRRELRQLAEEELVPRTPARSRIVECVLDGAVVHVGSTRTTELGRIVQLLRKAGVVVDFKTPWVDLGEPEAQSEVLDFADPVLSAHGPRFLRTLLDDDEVKLEPVGGYARLQTRYARVSLAGGVLRDVHRYLEDDAVELLAAKLVAGETIFTLDGPSFRVTGASLPAVRSGHWSEMLDARLERIDTLWDLLDRKYAERKRRRAAPRRGSGGKVIPISTPS